MKSIKILNEDKTLELDANNPVVITKNGKYTAKVTFANNSINDDVYVNIANIDQNNPGVSNIDITSAIKGNIGGQVTITFDLEDESGIDLAETYVMFTDGPGTSNQQKESSQKRPIAISDKRYKVEFDTLSL